MFLTDGVFVTVFLEDRFGVFLFSSPFNGVFLTDRLGVFLISIGFLGGMGIKLCRREEEDDDLFRTRIGGRGMVFSSTEARGIRLLRRLLRRTATPTVVSSSFLCILRSFSSWMVRADTLASS